MQRFQEHMQKLMKKKRSWCCDYQWNAKFRYWFFTVSHIDESIRLRKNGMKSDILILSYTVSYYFELLSKYKLTQALISLEYAKKLDSFVI